jgi:hypothetical protein
MTSACRVAMRFARLQELAEAPQVRLGAHKHENFRQVLRDIQEEISNRSLADRTSFNHSKRSVGPVLGDRDRPDQVYMSLRPMPGEGHGGTVGSLIYGGGVSEGALQSLMDNPTAALGNVVFGWNQSGYREASKNDPRRKELQALGFDYRQGLAEALKDLVAKSGLREGDFIENSPLGASMGDYRRALAYSRYGGFGPLNSEYAQHAIIGPGLVPAPFLQGRPNEQFAGERKWRVPSVARDLTALEIDELVGTLRQRLGMRDDAAIRPAAPEKLNSRTQASSKRGQRQQIEDYSDYIEDYFDPYFDSSPSVMRSQVGDYGVDYDWREVNPNEFEAQLGIPGVSRDLDGLETVHLARQQNGRIGQGIPPSSGLFRASSESDYYHRHGRAGSVIPGLRGFTEAAYEDVPF